MSLTYQAWPPTSGVSTHTLVQALLKLTALETLNLYSSELGAEGAEALAPALALLTRLSHLDLSMNNMGEAGVTALGPAIQVRWRFGAIWALQPPGRQVARNCTLASRNSTRCTCLLHG